MFKPYLSNKRSRTIFILHDSFGNFRLLGCCDGQSCWAAWNPKENLNKFQDLLIMFARLILARTTCQRLIARGTQPTLTSPDSEMSRWLYWAVSAVLPPQPFFRPLYIRPGILHKLLREPCILARVRASSVRGCQYFGFPALVARVSLGGWCRWIWALADSKSVTRKSWAFEWLLLATRWSRFRTLLLVVILPQIDM